MKRRHFSTSLALAAASIASSTAWAQDAAPTRILVGFPPGGAVDAVARLLADALRVSLGTNVIVENRPGAAGRLALGELRRSRPDGLTLAIAPGGALTILPWLYPNTLGYNPVKDFTPVSRLTTLDFALTVGPAAPAGDVNALFAWMKANPERATYATSGAGSVPHFAGLLIGQAIGVPLIHVPYRGGAPAVQDLTGGQVPLMIDSPSETMEMHRTGKLRILAVTGAQRSPALPEVPTLRQAGVDVVVDNFFGLYAPAALPPALAQRIDRASADALATPKARERLLNLGLIADHGGPQLLASTQASQYKRWEAPIKRSGFTVD